MGKEHYLGIDVGGSTIVYGVITAEGLLIKEKSSSTNPERGASVILNEILRTCEALIEEDSSIVGVGMGLPGTVDPQRGIARDCPNLHWLNIDVLAPFRTGLRVPVYLENDVRCMALAEHTFGAARGTENAICIALGTGIGSGIFVRGDLLRGTSGAAGEVGHMTLIPGGGEQCACRNSGCWETLASASAIIRNARLGMERAGRMGIPTLLKDPLDGKKVTHAALKGDSIALAVFEEAGKYLGIGLANLVNLFNPECIVIGGGMSLAGDLLFSPAKNEMLKRGMPNPLQDVRIVSAELGCSAGVIGAALLCLLGTIK
ncbi:MAG: ROK family protein [Bacillota bacterium]|nr:ROK family protein [Bacillota bacterium]